MAGFGELRLADEEALERARAGHLLTQTCGLGYYSLPGSPMNHQYASVYTILTIKSVAARFYSYSRTPIGIGDLSLQKYGVFAPHHTHQTGTNVDIRPLRKDRRPQPVTWRDNNYDRDATRELVEFLLADSNVKRILFNDPQIKGVHKFVGHDNHLHVEMKI